MKNFQIPENLEVLKLLPISDMHIESHRMMLDKYRGNADVIIAAGDIYTKTDGPIELRRIFGNREIILTPGNHEYYGSVLSEEDDRLRKACKNQGIHFLQCDSVEIKGVVFCGCTLWSDYKLFGEEREAEARFQVGQYLNDYRAIRFDRNDYRPISTLQTLEIHQRHKAWLNEQFEVYRDKALVIVTHHGPSGKCIHPSYTADLASAGFASNLDDLVESSGAKYWFCGHSHVSQHFKIGGTEVWQNCKGYSNEKIEGFNPWLVLEIDKSETVPVAEKKQVKRWPRLRDLPEEERKPFVRWLRGQTVPMIEGEPIEEQDAYYPWDYATWKAGLPVKD